MSKGPWTVRVARYSATNPWRVIGLWLVFVALCFTVGQVVGVNEATNDDQNIGEVSRASQIAEDGKFPKEPSENILITAQSGSLDKAQADKAAEAVKARMTGLTGMVTTVDDPVPSPDGKAVVVKVNLKELPKGEKHDVDKLLDATAAVQKEYPGLRIEEVGGLSIGKALNDTLGKDFQKAELFSIPVTLAILLIAFGALIAAGVPLLLALSAVASAIGLSAAASHLVPAVDAVSSVVLLVGMAVGVDYSLFYLRREREERAKGMSHIDAIELAAKTSGHAVVVSGFAVIVSMAGMFLANDTVFSSMAVGSILVVAIAMVGSLTVLPAVLGKLGRWVDRPRVPFLWRLTAPKSTPPKFWPFVLRPALRYPVVTFLISGLALAALAVPALNMKLRLPGEADLPRTTSVMQAYDRMTAAFPSTGTAHMVAIKAPAAAKDQVAKAVENLTNRTKGDALFAQDGLSKPRVSADGTVTLVYVATPYSSGSTQAHDSLDKLRKTLVPETIGTLSGAQYAVGGEVAGDVDYAAHVKEKLPLVIGFVLLLTFVMMTFVFRSVVVALTAILLNMLSVGAAYGLLVAVFQNGTWAESLLDFRSTHSVVSWLPLFLFVILFGLSMDYHVFVVSRIREARDRGLSNRQAVAEGITSSAGVVTSAAVVMVAVFGIFATLSTIDMKQLGVGLAAAILIDATLIRGVVLPSLMTLLGEANWWAPKFLRRKPAPAEPKHREREYAQVG
ncbi:MMPL family transporter [Longispora albida]|uniref:MMPL family transporter n=1 Tax=Longispora albida TaxID=203523 RepID=UPI000372684F|nr:MMPL family transporter [Longispora albida]